MFTCAEVLKAVSGKLRSGDKNTPFYGISTDSRKLKKGELFIALKGDKSDGHDYLSVAVKNGADGLLVSKPARSFGDAPVIECKDTLKALQDLASWHRDRFKIPVIGVTGSAGKTTTKDMIASILSQKYCTLKNEENFNNEIGVPLTLLNLTKKHKAAVIEMGMQGPGEIELLSRITRPDIAVITNIGEAHLKQLKTKNNIAKAKSEIFKHVKKGGWAVINQDDEFFEHLEKNVTRNALRVTTFGILEKADVTPDALKGIDLPLPGEHNIYNALAAVAVAKILKINRADIKKGLEIFRPSSNRMDIINRADGVKIINDTYNANPQSMSAALRTLASLNGRKIAVLGDMLELGKTARSTHRRILKLAKKLKIDLVFTFGDLWPKAFKDKKLMIRKLKKAVRPHDVLLIKGSRGMKMEGVVNALRR